VSPLSLRRYRAERLLRREFETLRCRVIGAVDRRLRASGPGLDRCDLEACYAAAWQGLYMTTLAGTEVENPAGWLVLVTFRRAVEERRARMRAHRDGQRMPDAARDARGETRAAVPPALERDLAAELDQRVRLRQLFEGLRGRLSAREREAAVLCYLQGLTRAEAAARMGVSDARMRKLMEGRGAGSPGVAGKVGVLVASVRDGRWCEEQGSLMRALAFGVLEPRGERHRLALAHALGCPACRSYVASLRGLAAVLPPVLAPWGAAAASLGGGIGGAASTPAVAGAGAGAGAAGGGWLLTGGAVGGKLALGCLVALGVGAGCAVIEGRVVIPAPSHRRAGAWAQADRRGAARAGAGAQLVADAADGLSHWTSASLPAVAASSRLPVGSAGREFGPERLAAAGARTSASAYSSSASSSRNLASAASSGAEAGSGAEGRESGASVRRASTAAIGSQVSSASATQAAREFSPG
jgi:DNA-directed RNA polymerase specialized sigma24 family protein